MRSNAYSPTDWESCNEKETIEFANSLLPDAGLHFIGRFAGDMFGYLKGSSDHRLYSYFEETGEKTLIAEDVEDFARKYLLPHDPEK